jgi:nitroimidazol reductase NimA-like FMN-containing flavoprotein (pyridoxamine 5'-phosphate oxidase superfamily)
MNQPVELTEAECLDLLSRAEVGRVALCLPSGPTILPVNYAVVDESIIFRTAPYSVLGASSWPSRLAFEIDHLDHERRSAWSVVAVGSGVLVEDPSEVETIRMSGDPQPWAGGVRLLYVRLQWEALTGRRIGVTP